MEKRYGKRTKFLDHLQGKLAFHSYVNWTDKLASGKLSHNYGKIHHAINGKIHYFYGHFMENHHF